MTPPAFKTVRWCLVAAFAAALSLAAIAHAQPNDDERALLRELGIDPDAGTTRPFTQREEEILEEVGINPHYFYDRSQNPYYDGDSGPGPTDVPPTDTPHSHPPVPLVDHPDHGLDDMETPETGPGGAHGGGVADGSSERAGDGQTRGGENEATSDAPAEDRSDDTERTRERRRAGDEEIRERREEAARARREAEHDASRALERDRLPYDYYGPTRERRRVDSDELSSQINRLGKTREREKGEEFPEDDEDIPLAPPPEIPPTTVPPERAEETCCGLRESVLFYPVTTDPQEIKDVQLATNDRRTVAYNVMPHNGGFHEVDTDLVLPSVGIDTKFVRVYRSDVKFRKGGLIGEGRDFNWNKRIVPIYPRVNGEGLAVEMLGRDAPALHYFDGTAHADRYAAKHSERRRVINFGETYKQQKRFEAYVTTYQSPGHQFLEIQRYVLYDPADHPFKQHPDVKDKLGEAIFYVVRLKDGTRYIFNCRGQMIYIFDKHHNKVEFRYQGPMNPLTQSPMLSDVIDTAERAFSVRPRFIGTAPINTNFDCRKVTGILPIPRVDTVIDPTGRTIEFHYTVDDTPKLDWLTRTFPGDVGLSTSYRYNPRNLLVDIIRPKGFGQPGRGYVQNTYDPQDRVVAQRYGAQTYRIGYDQGIRVVNSQGYRFDYGLTDLTYTKVIGRETVTDGANSWTTAYAHNGDGQITRITLPRGNSIEYMHDGQNDPVRVGLVRNWADRGLAYESDLSKGNLLGVRKTSDRPNLRVIYRNGSVVTQTSQQALPGGQSYGTILEAFSYEPIANAVETYIDRRGAMTVNEFEYEEDYGRLGVPVRIRHPEANLPDGTKQVIPDTTLAYSARGEPVGVRRGTYLLTNQYNKQGYLTRRTDPDGRTTEKVYRDDGQVTRLKLPEGYAIEYRRNGRGLVTRSTLAGIETDYVYDLHGNLERMSKDVKDLFPATGAGELGVSPQNHGRNVTAYTYDAWDRLTRETFTGHDGADASSYEISYEYDADDRRTAVTQPSPAGGTLTKRTAYDARNLVTREESGDRKRDYFHDDNGNVVREVDALGRTVFYFHDGFDRRIATADHAGGIMRRELDKNGNATVISFEGEDGAGGRGLLQETRTTFDEYDRPIRIARNSFTDGFATTEYVFDANHNMVREKGPAGQVTRYESDPAGRRTSLTDPLGNVTRYTYSDTGYLTGIEETEKEVRFDRPNGPPVEKTATYTTTMTNDPFGNPVSRTTAAGTVRMGYDSEGNVRVVLDEGGRRTLNSYNGRSQLVSVLRDGATSSFTYNKAGAKVGATIPGGAMTWEYNAHGEEVRSTNSVTGQSTSQRYDRVGQMISRTDPKGTTFAYVYDSRGRLTEVTGYDRFNYDGLGRVVEADGTVFRRYDGLGNIVSERQKIFGTGIDVTLVSAYKADGSERTLTLPAMGGAPAATYRWRMDALERVSTVELNGDTVARYDYSGRGRIARRTYANHVRSLYEFDGGRRATGMQVYSDIEGRNLWSGYTQYQGNSLVDYREFFNPDIGEGARSQSMSITLDAQHRPAVTETRVVTRTRDEGPYQQWVTRAFSVFDATGRATSRVSATFVNDQLTTVRSNALTFDKGQVKRTRTLFSQVRNGPGSAGFQLTEAQDQLSSPKFTENEDFLYDGNGNLILDTRFRYRYSAQNRLSSAGMEIDDQRRDNEIKSYTYDSFGRRTHVRHGPDTPSTRRYARQDLAFIHDGDSVVAELLLPRSGQPVLLARYVHGARTGEIIRMDRRQGDDPSRRLEPYYVHEGLTGGLNFVTDENFDGVKRVSRSREMHLTENLIEGTGGTRFPYTAWNVRYDPFLEAGFDEVRKTYQNSYTEAPIIDSRLRQEAFLAEVRKARDELESASLKLMAIAALPAAPMLPAAAWVGGGLSVGIDYTITSYMGGDYSFEQGMKAFALGALSGGFGSALQGIPALSTGTRLGLELGFDVFTGTLVDVATHGEAFSSSFMQNLLLSAVGSAGGKVQGWAAARFKGTPILGANVLAPLAPAAGMVSRAFRLALEDGAEAARGAARPGKVSKQMRPPRMSETLQGALKERIIEVLGQGTEMGWYVGELLKYGDLKIEFRRWGDARTGSRGRFVPGTNTLYVNEKFFAREYGNLAKSASGIVDLTSTVLHEGVHFLGGGEISAHLAQAQFLDHVTKLNKKLSFHNVSEALVYTAKFDSIMPLLDVVAQKGYREGKRKGVFLSQDHQPLHQIITDQGGFGEILGMRASSLELLNAVRPANTSF
jgi:YD repeat-containing protein